ncbi:hypothetical protein GUITHDRAFT_140839 [Guillardia theta CCMP2712]|uniref:Uncharacterized protein n=1 Tax=Guillardia theta (strain CCMP2712) TaxID=905079 RepID=L1J397_GUITC|nr:hypothetical protein GUITHDRAFT_140839 [Guillardia theta CCMP2712]EKX42986.1 hypothetical protein GUITHDRAFT_140839 [Guillardia theta CCMP2712]|eukprot:XP_005829966.1 hypothetical protein GUITHDRAFT_140839 [Guillardia theta CCMP2712]
MIKSMLSFSLLLLLSSCLSRPMSSQSDNSDLLSSRGNLEHSRPADQRVAPLPRFLALPPRLVDVAQALCSVAAYRDPPVCLGSQGLRAADLGSSSSRAWVGDWQRRQTPNFGSHVASKVQSDRFPELRKSRVTGLGELDAALTTAIGRRFEVPGHHGVRLSESPESRCRILAYLGSHGIRGAALQAAGRPAAQGPVTDGTFLLFATNLLKPLFFQYLEILNSFQAPKLRPHGLFRFFDKVIEVLHALLRDSTGEVVMGLALLQFLRLEFQLKLRICQQVVTCKVVGQGNI